MGVLHQPIYLAPQLQPAAGIAVLEPPNGRRVQPQGAQSVFNPDAGILRHDHTYRCRSAYSDPTAYQAMLNLEIEELRFKKLLRSIKDMCDLADFEIEDRVVLIDKRSGRVWR